MAKRRLSEDATDRFYRLVWPERAFALRLARVLAGSEAEAEELAQEAMLRAFRAIESFAEGTNLKAWLGTILRNVRTDLLRRSKKGMEISLDSLDAEPADVRPGVESDTQWQEPESILQAFSDQQVIDALQRLPEEIRWTLLLVDVEGLDQSEAATILAVPIGTVKSRSHRGRAMLREALLPLARELRLLRQ